MRPLLLSLLCATSCAARPAPPATAPVQPASMPASAPSAHAELETDDLLDAMEKVGVGLKSLRADLAMRETDQTTGAETLRTGTIVLQRVAAGDTRGHVVFEKLEENGRRIREKIEYLLSGDWVTDRAYGRSPDDPAGKRETQRQVRRPGDTTDLLRLGEGPFPLPIGQSRAAVKAQFEVTRLPDDAAKPTLIGLELRPKPSNKLAAQYETITVWVDPADAMPRVVETIDPNQSKLRQTTLGNVTINAGVTDADFTLEAIDEKTWTITKVPMGP